MRSLWAEQTFDCFKLFTELIDPRSTNSLSLTNQGLTNVLPGCPGQIQNHVGQVHFSVGCPAGQVQMLNFSSITACYLLSKR